MNIKFLEARKDLLSMLTKYRLNPLPSDEFESLIKKYDNIYLASAVEYFIQEGMIPQNALYSTRNGAILMRENLKLTSTGFNYATNDPIGN